MKADTNQGQPDMDISRIKFISTASGTLAIGVAAGSGALQVSAAAQQTSNLTSDQPEEQRRGDMLFRRLGRTREWVSLVGLGGNHLGKQALHYVMSLPTSVVITGIDKPEILDQALEAVRTYKKLDESQLTAVLDRTRTAATKGAFELYKLAPTLMALSEIRTG